MKRGDISYCSVTQGGASLCPGLTFFRPFGASALVRNHRTAHSGWRRLGVLPMPARKGSDFANSFFIHHLSFGFRHSHVAFLQTVFQIILQIQRASGTVASL